MRYGIILQLLAALVAAQDQPLSLRGTFATGYYSTVTKGESDQKLDFVPFGARFELTGYYKSADFLNFNVQPEFNVGPQATEAGFQGGNGIRVQSTFLRHLMPLTFRYSNVQLEDVVFGGLSQISGYSLKNRNRELGLTLEIKSKRLPSTTIDWGTASVDSKPGIAGIPDYNSSGHHVNVDSNYEHWGWTFDGFLHRQYQVSDLLEPIQGGTQFGSLIQTVQQYQGGARRTIFGDSELYLNAGSQSTDSMLFDLPVNLSAHYASANLRLFQKRRFKTLLRANYTTNFSSQLLAQAVGGLVGTGAVVPDQYVLLPFSRDISNLLFNATTTASLGYGFGMWAGLERNGYYGPISSHYLTTSAGITYNHHLSWGAISGEYGREYGAGSITGLAGTIQGQNWRAGLQAGRSDGWQIDGTVHGASQSVYNEQPLRNHSFSAEMSAAHKVAGQWSARAGGGWQWGTIVNSANEFRTNGFTARAGLDHPLVQVNATLNESLSNSLPFYGQALTGIGIDSALLGTLSVIPSDYRAMNFSLHANPLRKVEVSANWSRSRQHLAGILNNNFEIANVYVVYHFRRIELQCGLIRATQVFLYYPDTLRQRYYVRITRSAKIL